MKLCKDCVHSKGHWLFGWEYAKCRRHPPVTDPVTGKNIQEVTYCSTQRAFNHLCGPEAKFFEGKL